MIICWENLEKNNIRLTNRGNFRGDGGTYYYYDSCLECGEPFLSKSKTGIQYCSYECMTKNPEYKKSVGKYKSNLNIKNVILSKEEILKLRKHNPLTYIKIISNEYPILVQAVEDFCIANNLLFESLSQKLFHYTYNLIEYPKCVICNKDITKFSTLKSNWGYNNVCSLKCRQKTDTYKKNRIGIKNSTKDKIDEYINSKIDEIIPIKNLKSLIEEILNVTDSSNLEKSIYKRNKPLLWNIYNSFKLGNCFLEKVYLILNDINEIPKCSICNEEHCKFINYKQGYRKICSSKGCIEKYKENNKQHKTKEIFIKMSRKEILESLNYILNLSECLNRNDIGQLKNKHKNLYKNIINETLYLNKKCKFTERIYHILHNLYEIPKCLECGKTIDQKFSTFEKNYSDICKACSSKKVGKLNSITLSNKLRSKNYNIYLDYYNDEPEYELITTKEEFLSSGELEIKHNVCGHSYIRNIAFYVECPYCNKKHKSQNSVSRWLKKYFDIEIDKRKYLDNKFEIDIFVPRKMLGIEYDDISTHSENKGQKNKKYHLTKTELCEKKDIHLIHLLSTEWMSNRRCVKSSILSKLGVFENRIYARKCKIKELSSSETRTFLDKNHLQGYCNSSVRYGLFYNDELVSCMTFGKRKITGKTELELLRFCNKLNTQVVGGASKLFKHFVRNNDFDEIVSYADRRWSNGNLYEKLGFKLSHKSAPSYWYIVNNKLVHRSVYMKHKLPKLLEKFNPELTEWENMQMNGFDRIWDCGCLVYKFKK